MTHEEFKENILNNQELEIKKRIGIIEKTIMIQNIAKYITIEENGFKYTNILNKKVAINVNLLLNYTNAKAKLSENSNIVEIYNYCDENDIFKKIENTIDETELYYIEDTLNEYLREEKEKSNKLENVISNALTNILSLINDDKKIKEYIKLLGKQFKDVDFKSLINQVKNNQQ